MPISYRWTSGAALVLLTLPIVEMFLPPAPLRPRYIQPHSGAVGWDPCSLVAQLHPMYKLIVLVCFGAYVVFLVQGLRSRSGPRWLAVAGALALLLWIESDWWRVSAGCVSNRSIAILLLWAGTACLMFLHHLVQRPSGDFIDTREPPPTVLQGRLSRINRAVVPVLVFLPLGWSTLNAIRPFDREPTLKERAIDLLQRCLSWATLALVLIIVAFYLIVVVGRQRAALRAAGVIPSSDSE